MIERNPSQQLKAYGINRGIAVRRRPWIYIALIICIAVGLGLVQESRRDPKDGFDGSKVATAVVALGALCLGYQQWRSARFETSIDKFFERLENTNKKLQEGTAVRELLDAIDDQSNFQQSMYVFSELDNLEYVMQKYKYGFMSAEQALRGVKTFKARCVHYRFRERAKGCIQVGGYSNEIIEVFRNICNEIQPKVNEN